MKILITGGAGFVGSHVAEYYTNKGDEVIVFDNLSRAKLLGYEKPFYQTLRKFNQNASQKESFTKDISSAKYNWNYLKRYENIELIKGDMRNAEMIKDAAKDVDVKAINWDTFLREMRIRAN